MTVHAAEDVVYIHGGYSREKKVLSQSGKSGGGKTEGIVHQDTWMLNLKPALAPAAAGGARGKLDLTKLNWQKVLRPFEIDFCGSNLSSFFLQVSKKGAAPSPRCGAVMATFKNKGIMFGGVYDNEGHGHSMTSKFYNDLYALDFD